MNQTKFISIIFIFFSFVNKAYSRCYEPDDPAVIDEDTKVVILDKCIKPVYAIPGIYGWEILKLTMNKSSSTPVSEKIMYPGKTGTIINHVRESYNLRSGKNRGERCNTVFNTPGLFYKKFDNNGNPTGGWVNGVRTKINLRKFWDSMPDYDSDEDKESRGFKDGSFTRLSSERMYHSNDDTLSPDGKSTCSAVGMCICKQSTQCTELSTFYNITVPEPFGNQGTSTRVRNPNNFNYDISQARFTKKNNWCYELKSCNGNDKSPYAKCIDDGLLPSSSCSGIENRCLYTAECKMKTTETSYDTMNLPTCEHSFECGSGYCEKIPNDIIQRVNGIGATVPAGFSNKVCLPHAVCAPKCKGLGETLSQSYHYCCPGLLNFNNTCEKFARKFEEPPELTVERVDPTNPDDCRYELGFVNVAQAPNCFGAEHWTSETECEAEYEWDDRGWCEVNGFNDSSIAEPDCIGGRWFAGNDYVKMQYIYYTRLFEGLQWLWGRANSPGVNDVFGMYTRARQTFQRFAEDNKKVTDDFYEIMDVVKRKFTDLAQTEGASTGVSALRAMEEMYTSLADLSVHKSSMYYDLSGMEVVLNPPINDLSYQALLNFEETRVSGSLTDNKLGGSNYVVYQDPSKTQRVETSDEWKFKTLLGLFKKINSMKPLNSGNANGRFDAHQGNDNCGFGRRRIGKSGQWCTDRGRTPNAPAWCDWEIMTSFRGVNDGDCVKDGWRIDNGPGSGIHSSPGHGGILDGIYPDSLQSSTFSIKKEKLYSSIINGIFNKAKAGAKRIETGVEQTPLRSGQLLRRIERDWKLYADEVVSMTNTNCIGSTRARVPGTISLNEAYFMEKYVNGNTVSFDIYKDRFKLFPNSVKRRIFLDFGARIINDFFVRFHWHDHDPAKATYRFYKDRSNDNEYNGMVDLLNGALWLSHFHEVNVDLNRQLASCIGTRANELEASLVDSSVEKSDENYEALVTNLNKEFPDCPDATTEVDTSDSNPDDIGGQQNNVSSFDTSAGAVAGVGEEPPSDGSLGEGEKKGDLASNLVDTSTSNSLSSSSLESSSSDGAGSLTTKSGTSSSVSSKGPGTRAKIESVRKKILKKKGRSPSFLRQLASKLSDHKNVPDRIKSVNAEMSRVPKVSSLSKATLDEIKKKPKKEKEKIKEEVTKVGAYDDGDYYDDYDDDDESSSGEGSSSADEISESLVDKKLYNAVKRNSLSYRHNPNDTIFQKISKTYMTTGLRKLLGLDRKRVRKGKLPSLKTKNSKKQKKRFFD